MPVVNESKSPRFWVRITNSTERNPEVFLATSITSSTSFSSATDLAPSIYIKEAFR